jgi:hypothetical protein
MMPELRRDLIERSHIQRGGGVAANRLHFLSLMLTVKAAINGMPVICPDE